LLPGPRRCAVAEQKLAVVDDEGAVAAGELLVRVIRCAADVCELVAESKKARYQ
jgi:hypothetical protein